MKPKNIYFSEFVLKSLNIAQINTKIWITLNMFDSNISGLPYTGLILSCITKNKEEITKDDKSNIATIFALFQRRIVAMIINTRPNIPDIMIRAGGNLKFPSRSVADAITDRM